MFQDLLTSLYRIAGIATPTSYYRRDECVNEVLHHHLGSTTYSSFLLLYKQPL
jgi:hypothetical protein